MGFVLRRLSALVALAWMLGVAAPSARALSYSPYVDMTRSGDPALPAVQRATHARLLSLGFVIGSHSRCRPSWGGTTPLSSPLIKREVARVRAAGAGVVVSFGGMAGPDLARACRSVAALAGAYETTVQAYDSHRVDFDLEGVALEDHGASAREIRAIGALEQWARTHHRGLEVSLTVPVVPAGFESDVRRVLATARNHAVRLDIVNIMAMDYGDAAAPPGANTMAGYAIEAAQNASRQVSWSHLGVIAMIGVNDDANEIFGVADAQALNAFAHARRLARLGIWSAARDRACARPAPIARDDCSGVTQAPWQFSQILSG